MKTPPRPAEAPDMLLEVERRIARRADQIARRQKRPPRPALECWLEAEREIWSRFPPATISAGWAAR